MGRPKAFDRDIVLQKAMELFWKKGFHATSMQDLVDYLGIHRASIYEAFGNKQGLYEEALRLYRKTNNIIVQRFLDAQDDVHTGLKKLLLLSLSESLEDEDRKGCFMVNCTTEFLSDNFNVLKEITENKSCFEKFIGDFLKKGKKKKQVAADLNIKHFASYLFTFFSGLKVIAKFNHNRKELVRSIEIALNPILEKTN